MWHLVFVKGNRANPRLSFPFTRRTARENIKSDFTTAAGLVSRCWLSGQRMNSNEFSQQTLVLSPYGVSVNSKQKCELKQKKQTVSIQINKEAKEIYPNPFCEERKRAKWACTTNARMIEPGDTPPVTLRMKARQGRDVAWTLLRKRRTNLKPNDVPWRSSTTKRNEPFQIGASWGSRDRFVCI